MTSKNPETSRQGFAKPASRDAQREDGQPTFRAAPAPHHLDEDGDYTLGFEDTSDFLRETIKLRERVEHSLRPRRKAVLILLDGMRVSERFVLEHSVNVIGRDPKADIKIADGEVSRRHALVRWQNNQTDEQGEPVCMLEDCGSTNGTYLNTQRIAAPQILHEGDHIRVGRTVLGYFVKDERVLELDQMLMSMALRDSLTGLSKREVFFSELHREFERARRHSRPLSLAILDIDFFKRVNDQHGHLVGDEALRAVADLIRLSMREGDISGRYGGEEFAIVLPETEAEGAYLAVERIRMAIEQASLHLGVAEEINLTISCGLATLRPGHEDKLQLLDDADHALLEAKRAGRNRTVVSQPQT